MVATGRRFLRRVLFPGDKRTWLGALLIALPILGALGHSVTKPRAYLLGSNSVGATSLVVTVPDGGRLCVPQLELPAGTAQVQVVQLTYPNLPSLHAQVIEGGRTVATGRSQPGPSGSFAAETIPIAPALPARPGVARATVCISPHGERPGRTTQFGGMVGLESGQESPTLDGQAVGSRISLWFLPRPGAERSLLANWSAMMHRVALFRPGFAGPWLYYVLFIGVLPLLGYAALRLLAVADTHRRSLLWSLGAIAFVTALSWAILTSAFDSPDESEHFAYTQAIAEQGRAPDPAPSPRAPYASDETLALEAVHHFSTIETPASKPPWLAQDEARWRARVTGARPSRSDGGGFSTAVGPHSPLYYSLLVGGYALGRAQGTFAELFWMRATSALLSVVVALAAYGIVRELAPRRTREAVAAGLLVAFEPMFGFISGAVNNDNAVNAAAAGLTYLLVRALRRGLTARLGIAIGVVAGILPLAKGTGYELFPALIVAMALIAARGLGSRGSQPARTGLRPSSHLISSSSRALAAALRRHRSRLFGLAAAALGFGLVTLVWSQAAAGFQRATVTTPGGVSPATTVLSGGQLGPHLVYIWEVLLPRLPFMAKHWSESWPFFHIYIRRGFGAFSWYDLYFNRWVYEVIVAVMAIVFAGIGSALLRHRDAIRDRWRELLVLTMIVLGVFAGVEFAYYSPTPRTALAEQGRYAFPAIAALAALAVFGVGGAPRRVRPYALGMLVTAMIGLDAASHVLYLALRYT